MQNVKHIFFDLDDTLWDFEKNSSLILRDLFSEFSLSEKLNTSFDTFHSTYKAVNLDFWSRYGKKQIDKQYLRNHRFNETFKKFSYDNYEENLVITDHYLNRAPLGKHLKEGCIELLNHLKEKYTLHIITNGFKEIQNIKIDSCGLRNYFSQIIISEEYQLNKPDEKIFRLSEKLANCKKEDCVMIGDNFESDIEGALGAGWKAIWLNEHPHNDSEKNTFHKVGNLNSLRQIF